MKNEHLEFLSSLFPFRNLEKDGIEAIFRTVSYEMREYSKGDTVISPENCRREIGFVYSGECIVEMKRTELDAVQLNTVGRYGSFGILSVINGEEQFPTRIVAKSRASVLFISGEDMLAIIGSDSTVSMNVIRFLASRIAFLNGKLDTFSGKSTLARLASYLLSQYYDLGNSIPISKTQLARIIGVGRASVYRDIEILEQIGAISAEQKRIIIISPEGLERIKK